jgi:hypothetical protein
MATWRFGIERDATAPAVDYTSAWPGPDGTAVFFTHIGPRLTSDPDYGTPSIPVIGVLQPDGSFIWRQLPEGWQVYDSNRWGILLARSVDNGAELAMYA